MEVNDKEPISRAIQDIIHETVDRAIATLLETGLIKRARSHSRSHNKGKKGKGKKRSSSSSSTSSSSSSSSSESDSEHERRVRRGKSKKRHRSRSLDKGAGKGRRARSQSGGRHSRHSKSHHKQEKRNWYRHHKTSSASLLPLYYYHYFNCPHNGKEGPGLETEVRGRRGGHKKHSRRFRCPFAGVVGAHTTDDEKTGKTNAEADRDAHLTKEFENLEVEDKEKFYLA